MSSKGEKRKNNKKCGNDYKKGCEYTKAAKIFRKLEDLFLTQKETTGIEELEPVATEEAGNVKQNEAEAENNVEVNCRD